MKRFKENARNKITNIKNGAQKFKENFSEAKSKPRSKGKPFLLGVTTVISIFGLTLLGPSLSASAQDIPKNISTDVPKNISTPGAPTPPGTSSQPIIHGLPGAAATIGTLAAISGPFVIGAVCGGIIVIGILKVQGK
jgi:hypothetical protein